MKETNRFGLGVIVCTFNKSFSKILLLKRNEEKRKWGATWGNVGGKVEFGETSLQSALREFREEIGITLKPSELELIHVKENPKLFPHWHGVHFVYAAIIDEDSKITINGESDDYRWFSIDELPDSMLDKKEDIIEWRNIARSKLHEK